MSGGGQFRPHPTTEPTPCSERPWWDSRISPKGNPPGSLEHQRGLEPFLDWLSEKMQ